MLSVHSILLDFQRPCVLVFPSQYTEKNALKTVNSASHYLCPQYIHCETPAEHNMTPCKCVGRSRFALPRDKIPNHLDENNTFVHVLTPASCSLWLSPNDNKNVMKVLGQMAVCALWSLRCRNDYLNFDHAFKCKVWPLIVAKDDFGMVSLMQAIFNLCLGNFHGCFPRCKLANVQG